jgi:DNA polymerase elongation subunit (family B)
MRVKLASGTPPQDEEAKPRRVKLASGAGPEPAADPSPTPAGGPRRVRIGPGDAPAVPAARPSAPVAPRAVNVFYNDTNLVIVQEGGTLKRHPARFSFFVEAADLDAEDLAKIKGSRAVVGVSTVGKWHRIDCRDFEYRRMLLKALAAGNIKTYEGDLNPVRRHLLDYPLQIVAPRACFLDLETDSRVPFSKKEEMRLLCASIVDAETKQPVWLGMLEQDDDVDERRLLTELWQVLNGYDQIIAWNGDRFDFPVLAARTKKRGLNVPWKRWLWLDYLELFRRMNTMAAESGDEKQSMALDAVCRAVLGEDEGKLDLDASKTWEYWDAGGSSRAFLGRYCEHDTTRMPALEEATGYIALLNTLCEVTGTFPDSRGVNPQQQVEAFLLRLAMERGMKPETRPSSYEDRKKEGEVNEFAAAKAEQFRGAFVLKPKTRGFERGVHVCDFAGLYPNIILSWNMSPETRRAPLPNPNDARPTYLPRVEYDPEKNVRTGCAYAPGTGEIFDQTVPGMLPDALEQMMKLRKVWNERKAKAAPGTPEWKDADRRSTAYKIAANSFYGVIGAQTSRFYVREVAESVTQAGVWLIQQTIRAAEAKGMKVVYGDTDSAFVKGATEDAFRKFTEWCNTDLYPMLLAAKGCARNKISLAYEKEFDWLVIVTAKRYVGKYAHYKGTRSTSDSKPEVRGLEYKRGDTARFARLFQKDVIDLMMSTEDRDAEPYRNAVEGMKKRILEGELQLEDFVISKRLSQSLKSYKVRVKKDGTSAAGQPHVMIGKILQKRGRDMGEGAKVEYVCVDGSTSPKQYIPAEDYGIEVNGKMSPPVDRYELWESVVYPPTMRLLQAAFPDHDWERYEKSRPPKPKLTKAAKQAAASGTGTLFD